MSSESQLPDIGRKRTIALALAATNLDVIHRSTLRALCPTGARRPPTEAAKERKRAGLIASYSGKNRETVKFQDTLREFDRSGWISRETEYVRIIDREALLDIAFEGEEALPSELLDIAAGILASEQRVEQNAEIEQRERGIEQRERELVALRALMQAPVTGTHRGRGAVRRVGVAGSRAV